MIDRHWDGIAAYCKPENKVSLGFVEGLNNKIRRPFNSEVQRAEFWR
jgi:transposase